MKIQNTLVGLGFIFLTIAGSPKVSAQAYCVFPLTAQQIEHDEGDQFYASFVHNYSLCWHKMVFNSLIHKGSAKKIEVSQYREITAFDELQMEEVESWVFTYNNKYKCWNKKILKENIQNRKALHSWSWAITPSEASSCNGNFPIVGAQTKNVIEYDNTKITYNRDQKQRVISATVKNNNNTTNVTKFEYLNNSDKISSIKSYNGSGNLKYEVNYEYTYINGNPYLKKASHRIPTSYPNGTTKYEYTEYTFGYGKDFAYSYPGKDYDVVNVKRVWYDENEIDHFKSSTTYTGYMNKTDEFSVSIERYSNGDIKTVRCPDNPPSNYKGVKMVWTFLEYDDHHNWTKMILEDNGGSARIYPKTQLTREITYDQPKPETISSSTSNPTSKTSNTQANDVQNASTKTSYKTTSNDLFSRDASSYRFSESDLSPLSAKELTYLRNSVYAKHGYVFKSQELNNYFKQFGWYHPDSSVTEAALNNIEKTNVQFIKNYQEQNGKTYKPQ